MQKKVLIAEDEKPMAMALKLKLEKEGFKAQIAYNGNECLEQIKDYQPDLLLLDIMMPEKDGFAVLEELKKQGNKIPVLVSSNLSQKEDFERAEKLGAKGFYVKSNTTLADIIKKIKQVLKIQ